MKIVKRVLAGTALGLTMFVIRETPLPYCVTNLRRNDPYKKEVYEPPPIHFLYSFFLLSKHP